MFGPEMQSNGKTIDEQRLDELEALFPTLAEGVFIAAYRQALRSGCSVVVSEHDRIIEIFPDGRRELLKLITPPSPARPGQKYKTS